MTPEYHSSDQEEPTDNGSGNQAVEDLQLGVWSLRMEGSHSTVFEAPKKLWKEIQDISPFVLHLVTDVYTVAPYHLIVYLFCKFVHGLQDLLLLAFSDKLLRIIEAGLLSGTPDVYEISFAIFLRLACAFLFASLKWYGYVIFLLLMQ
ncbi:hypothetical protein HYPSUDRAFT_45801 [Hypholoma sublateritium FD-334 SS-4]|uniref:Uncharacterized protein n=1 Tax=Hypholoma sublateritium (strain FD-334 SS-4) TaxID=945553 RepID=A0A0D2NMJ3_HYPSF|nr:hypothetical protein HYPSUDRAFT_45801 [Hypholoma sublateritium FD-334 SS-4]